jgi:hypothetical protein
MQFPDLPAELDALSTALRKHLETAPVVVLPPADAAATLERLARAGIQVQTTILDPWYNKGYGGIRSDYYPFLIGLLERAAVLSQHVFLWGFPEIVAPLVERIPKSLQLVAWLTWYYKNSPSVIRGWRSSQMACLHLARPGAPLYPEHFLNERQRAKQAQRKLRFMPAPTSVIEEPLLVGFVGREEQTGHPAKKPVAVFARLLLMTTRPGDIALDPMCGSGTTGIAARQLGRRAILCDSNPEYLQMTQARLATPATAEIARASPRWHRRSHAGDPRAMLFDPQRDR